MKIAIAADFNAHDLKDAIKKHLEGLGHEVFDYSGEREAKHLFYDIVPPVVEPIQESKIDFGILICGTGMGVSLFANKYKGIYAAPCESVYAAKKARVINNANVLTMGAWIVGPTMACEMAETFITHSLGEGLEDWRKKNVASFYQKTIDLENEHFK